jgi:diguanylate cyclase (GGDEF)-like protein
MGARQDDVSDSHKLPYSYETTDTQSKSISQANDGFEVAPILAPRKWRTEALGIIHRLSHDVIDSTLVAPVLDDIAHVMTSSFPITYVAIETYDNDELSFSAWALNDEYPFVQTPRETQLVSLSTPPLSATLAGEVMRRNATLILSDAHSNGYCICPSLPGAFNVFHYIGVPLIVDGETRGVLSIATAHHIVVDKETVTWAETAAHHISALLTRDVVHLRLKSQENIAVNMLNALTSPTVMVSSDGVILNINSAFRLVAEEFHERSIDTHATNIFSLFDNPTKTNSYVHEFRTTLQKLFHDKVHHSRLDILVARGGFHRWYLATMSLMPDHETAIIMFVDISDRKKAEEMLEHEMLHDQSTGLANRVLFHDRLNNAHSYNSMKGESTCVIALDIGRYAFIVESLGHQTADEIVTKVAKRIESKTHPNDVIARVGSSEFALLIEHIHNAEQARNFSLEIIELFQHPFEIDGQEILLHPALGITVTDATSSADADMILHDAHAAMTQARDTSVLPYAFSSVSRSSQAYKKLKRERELMKAIDDHQLRVYYQPECELLTGSICGVEALVRWIHPRHGILTPDQFIDLAEESGLIEPLFERVFSMVVEDIEKVHERGHNFTFWTNLSAKQIAHDNTLKFVSSLLHRTDIPAHMVGMEITETAVMENSEAACDLLAKFQSLGVSISLDDFGTGYSSLAYLQRFPVDMIKIDKTFIAELGQTTSASEIVSAVIGLAHGLRLHVLAEGVETAQQVALLRELGCDRAQGYFFSHPLTFEKFLTFLED